ncbi:MAG: 3,5-nucleoside bisphosphate phosphatase [Candidatus Atribacteria bacterium]|jgi:hypothetical protein|nr:3,5-nucleoside bisphosphate phosphatase [Candidatus Atribacteria bacterium]
MSETLLRADLHIHSVLSPCAQREMLPHCIVFEALQKKLDVIAVTDHNACENVGLTMELGQRFGLWVVPGIEVESKEEIHLLCFFPTLELLTLFNREVDANLSRIPINEEIWGEEWVIDEEGAIKAKKEYLLTYPTQLSAEELITLARKYQGFVVPSHIDRASYSVLANLGFIPREWGIETVEISSWQKAETLRGNINLGEYVLVSFSDAHSLSEIGRTFTLLEIQKRDWTSLLQALTTRKFFPHQN